MHAPICTARIQAARHEIAAMSSRVWELVHPETGCLCRAEYDSGLLTVEVTSGPDSIDVDGPYGWAAYERAVWDALDDLAKAGVLRTFVGTPAAAERELRLITNVIREVAP